MKTFTFSIIIILIFLSAAISQVHQDWVQRFNGPGNGIDIVHSLAVDASGNVCITGESNGGGTGADFLTIVYNLSGVQQWNRRYNGQPSQNDRATSIAVDASGNVYVTGASSGNGTTLDYATIKYNSSGVQQWVKRYNGPGNYNDSATAIAVDASGNVYVTGTSWGSGTGYDYATIKYNSAGVQQWVQRYDGPAYSSSDIATAIAVDGSGNVLITGSNVNGYNYVTIKYNSTGVQQWLQEYSGAGIGGNIPTSLKVDDYGNVYVTGSGVVSVNNIDFETVKYSSSGTQLWAKRYNGIGNGTDIAKSIAVDEYGNVYVTGYSLGSGSSFYDIATIKYYSSGVQQWVQRYTNPVYGADQGNSLALDASGNVYVTGITTVSGQSSNYITIKYNPSGAQQWLQTYNGPGNGNDIASVVCLDVNGNVFVTGGSTGSGSDYDCCTIKYSQQIGIKKISSEIPDKFSLSQNYPNPFNPSTTIEFDIPKTSYTKLIVYDLLGKEIESLVNEELKAGSYMVNFNGDRLSSGVYYYKLVTNDFSQTRRMVVLK